MEYVSYLSINLSPLWRRFKIKMQGHYKVHKQRIIQGVQKELIGFEIFIHIPKGRGAASAKKSSIDLSAGQERLSGPSIRS